MMIRIVQLLVGAALAAGGGYLSWLNRALAPQLFPPDPHHAPWMLIAGLVGVIVGAVLLVEAVLPHKEKQAQATAAAERRRTEIAAADVYYAERARAADRDWRSGELPPGPSPAAPAASPFDTSPFESSVTPAAPLAATSAARPSPATFAGSAFPSAASLEPIPPSVDGPIPPLPTSSPAAPPVTPPLAVQPAASPPGPALVFNATDDEAAAPANDLAGDASAGPFDAIRTALAAGQLDEADRLLASERARLTAGGVDGEIDLAELTGLAGDHAAASGRIGGAKWLWRLSLQRFGAANAMTTPAARAVSERLRLADQ